MSAGGTVLRELIGLFVEDGALALQIVGLVAIAGVLAMLLPGQPLVAGAVLLVGSVGTLLLSVGRARRSS
ncbi:MAG TPA: hypothetical protein VGP48_09710 [Stellaceae bacterium]|nr:hypothetical protein [Stellaceae bacterium]